MRTQQHSSALCISEGLRWQCFAPATTSGMYCTILRSRGAVSFNQVPYPAECSESGSTGAWSTATLFWLMIFSFSFGLGFLRRDAVADKLWSWQSPDSVRQTPSWVYVLDRSGKTQKKANRD
ncbi:hypothetical protein EYF80_044009 [Liparis tanakae]|uniref:Uncharacterized protein n=1 Tax=Liparis tanakae TaxID=230148 RepID=A0A4Z2FX37_9TELE|nr:hypothetical protein EYF80_044009 [Liparis tanakae]